MYYAIAYTSSPYECFPFMPQSACLPLPCYSGLGLPEADGNPSACTNTALSPFTRIRVHRGMGCPVPRAASLANVPEGRQWTNRE
jgi:hypothetical protein